RRIMTAMGSAPLSEFGAGLLAAEEIDASPSYRRLIQEVIREVAAQGNVVILAHGASILLAGTPGLLRVLVPASPATRVRPSGAALQLDPSHRSSQSVSPTGP